MKVSADQKTRRLYEFGPFRVDPEKELLLRDDEAIPLAPKAFHVLLVLIRHSNQLVTKDDLLKVVWPDTFVEEANLSRNIFLLRKALGENPQDHQYIVTVPGHGYRFAEDVQLVPDRELNIVAASHSTVQMQVKETRPWGWNALVAVLLLAVAAGAYKLFAHHAPAVLTEKDTVVLAGFANSTGDPVFDGTLRQGMAVQLEQSPFLKLLSDDRVEHELWLMGQQPGTQLTARIAQEVCERTGSAAVLDGSIARVGSEYVLGLQAKDCQTGDMLFADQAQAARKEDVLNILSQMARKFRTNAGESLAAVEKHNTPLMEATTPSLDALKAYSEGVKVSHMQGEVASIPLLKRAIELDPDFAVAYAWLGLEYSSASEPDLAAEYESKAYQLRDRANDRERFLITAYYDGRVTGNMEKARQTCETWETIYPRDSTPPSFLAGFIYPTLGEYEKGVAAAEKVIELDPDAEWAYVQRGTTLAALNRLDEAENTYRRASERGIATPDLLVDQYDCAFLRADQSEMDRMAARARGVAGAEDWMLEQQAATLAFSGHLKEARLLSQQALDAAQRDGLGDRSALFETRAALREALYGNMRAAVEEADKALGLAKSREVEYGAGFTLALAGDSAQAEALANDLERRFPEDTAVRFTYLPALRARLALNHHEPLKAIEQLQVARRYEFGMPRSEINGYFGALYPVYVCGEAYLDERQGSEAAAEFQKILDHRGIVLNDPIAALAHLQLGRAFVLARDENKARAEYQKLLTLWKDADPDLPVLRQARAEYEKLARKKDSSP